MSSTDRRELGRTSGPLEDELEDAVDRIVSEGVQRLHRTWREVLVTGFLAGAEVALGILGYLEVRKETGNPLVASMAFAIGFVALLLGRSELFTEGFLVPVTTVVARRASIGQLLKLWSGTLVTNLAGGWVLMWLIMIAFPQLHHETLVAATHFVDAPLTGRSFALAVLGGAAITLMTRMQHGTDSTSGKILAAFAGAFLLTGLELFHSILDSLLIFAAILTGRAPFGYVEWAGWFWYTVVGNMLGGFVLITLLRLLRSQERLVEERAAARAGDPPAA